MVAFAMQNNKSHVEKEFSGRRFVYTLYFRGIVTQRRHRLSHLLYGS